ncbi:hypothetical protein QYM36_013730, partial [Artemia franciscana]
MFWFEITPIFVSCVPLLRKLFNCLLNLCSKREDNVGADPVPQTETGTHNGTELPQINRADQVSQTKKETQNGAELPQINRADRVPQTETETQNGTELPQINRSDPEKEFLNRYLVKEENIYVILVEKRKTASLKYVSVSISLREEKIFKEYLSFVQPALLKPGALVLSNFLLTTTGTKLENMSVIQRFLKKVFRNGLRPGVSVPTQTIVCHLITTIDRKATNKTETEQDMMHEYLCHSARDSTIDTCDCHPQQTYFGCNINHKAKEDSPNLKLRLLVVNDIKRPFLIATRDIWAGEELKFDYGLRPSDFHEGHEQAFFLPEAMKCRKEVANKIEEKRQTETSVHRQGAPNRQRCMIQKTPGSHQGPRNQE